MLVLTRKPNQQLHIGNDIVITVVKVRGNTIRLGIEAPRDVRVVRSELDRATPSEASTSQPPVGDALTSGEASDNEEPSEASRSAGAAVAVAQRAPLKLFNKNGLRLGAAAAKASRVEDSPLCHVAPALTSAGCAPALLSR